MAQKNVCIAVAWINFEVYYPIFSELLSRGVSVQIIVNDDSNNARYKCQIDRAKGVCRAGGGKAGDSETSTTGSTAFSDRITEDLQEKAGSYRSSGVQEVGGMSEPRMRYEDNLHHYALQQEIASLERHIHHDIDNWEMDMSKDLLDELKDLEKKCRSVNQRMKKDIARNSQEPLQGV